MGLKIVSFPIHCDIGNSALTFLNPILFETLCSQWNRLERFYLEWEALV